MQQHSEEWHQARLGKVTASRVADVIAKTKSGYSASRANYMAELICERLTGQSAERYSNAAMQWGTETEPQARASYELVTGQTVVECGLSDHAAIQHFGASPDGLVGDHGLVEIKCPNSATHIETLLAKSIDGKYITQMQSQMACTGRLWCDFVSFDPRLPTEMQLIVQRVNRDDELIRSIQIEVGTFLGELAGKIERLKSTYSTFQAAA
jgi:putative phage-type endonuclease